MKKALVVVFIVSCCALFAPSLAEDDKKPPGTMKPPNDFSNATDPTPPKPTPPKPTPPKPTPPKPTPPKPTPPKPTTPKPTTPKPTTPKPTTPKPTTPKPTTPKPTTHKPTTHKPTTHKPTTHKPTTHKPTTHKPTTHKPTTHKPTTTVPATTAPSPVREVPVGHYNVTKDKHVCVMAKIGLKIRLVSAKHNGSFTVQPNMTTARGDCKDPNANLTLSFPQGFITFLFNKNVTAKNVVVNSVRLELNYPLAKAAGSTPYKATNNSKLFVARIGHAYSCREESIIMGNGLYLDVTKDNIQAFNFSKSNEFGSPDFCPADRPNYSVAIAVGVTLLVLIIIVVVAYLVGRRRRSDGYQSL